MKERCFLTQLIAMANGAADDPALHIAATFVARNHAVAHQKGSRADVVSNHAQGLVAQISTARLTRSRFNQGIKDVDFVIAVHVLQDGGQALQAHAGVHAGGGQFVQAAISLHIKLHEHVVPDFNETVAVFTRAAGWAAGNMVAVVIKDLRAWATRAGVSHHPEVIALVFLGTFFVTNTHHALRRQANFLGPDVIGLVIVNVDRGQQLFCGQAVHLGQQLPAPLQ